MYLSQRFQRFKGSLADEDWCHLGEWVHHLDED
jgi:hypothetical protein